MLDDVHPMRALSAEPSIATELIHSFPVAPAQQYVSAEGVGYRSTGHAMFFGERRPYGALLHYWIGEGADGSAVSVEIFDEGGALVRELNGSGSSGVNRVVWDLRRGLADADGAGDPTYEVLPGVYTVRVTAGDERSEGSLTVVADPRSPVSLGDRRAKVRALERVGGWLVVGRRARGRIDSALDDVSMVLRALPEGADGTELRERGQELKAELQETRESLFTGPR